MKNLKLTLFIMALLACLTAVVEAQGVSSDLPPPVSGPGIEMTTGQALYTLPRDHAWHGGKFYQSNDYNEWHYITVLGTDLDTAEHISVF